MAITQQLARVSAEYLASCRTRAAESSDGDHQWDPPAADSLDLDWAPAMLIRVCEIAGIDDSRLAALRQATDGGVVLDVGFLNAHPHAIGLFGPTPTGLEAIEVERVSDLLGDVDFRAALAALPSDDHMARMLIGHGAESLTHGPGTYLRVHFDALREFYEGASKRGLVIVSWWD
ncbi:DUF1877 domain-containing protein [Streptomyces sp. BE147]|uniref:DUF1877 domain-containing protein n=1 Tax=unclassified Streptomyces TaxID=2593676 RepID=UPI002E79606E|nr:DUF1877 domain-containing protein [Streptomyces sp. BE147]MEE1735793.1 DUF1877 domain-containing protein [Streptomyces sp. BE147]